MNNFISTIKDKDVVKSFKELDNLIRFISDLLNDKLKEVDFSNNDFLEIFESGIINWLKGIKDNKEFICTNMILKINKISFLQKYANIITKNIITEDDKAAFSNKWGDNKDISVSFPFIKEYLKEQENTEK